MSGGSHTSTALQRLNRTKLCSEINWLTSHSLSSNHVPDHADALKSVACQTPRASRGEKKAAVCDLHHIAIPELGANIFFRRSASGRIAMSQHMARPARVLSWRQVKRGIVALRRRARSSESAACEDRSVREVALSRWEPIFKLPNRFSRSY